MPTYVYECSHCEQQFETQQRITEDPLDTCVCGSKGTVKRVIQPIAVVFKGSGFHINDYSSSATAKPASSETASSDAAPASAEPGPASTESKPAEAAPAPIPAAETT